MTFHDDEIYNLFCRFVDQLKFSTRSLFRNLVTFTGQTRRPITSSKTAFSLYSQIHQAVYSNTIARRNKRKRSSMKSFLLTALLSVRMKTSFWSLNWLPPVCFATTWRVQRAAHGTYSLIGCRESATIWHQMQMVCGCHWYFRSTPKIQHSGNLQQAPRWFGNSSLVRLHSLNCHSNSSNKSIRIRTAQTLSIKLVTLKRLEVYRRHDKPFCESIGKEKLSVHCMDLIVQCTPLLMSWKTETICIWDRIPTNTSAAWNFRNHTKVRSQRKHHPSPKKKQWNQLLPQNQRLQHRHQQQPRPRRLPRHQLQRKKQQLQLRRPRHRSRKPRPHRKQRQSQRSRLQSMRPCEKTQSHRHKRKLKLSKKVAPKANFKHIPH